MNVWLGTSNQTLSEWLQLGNRWSQWALLWTSILCFWLTGFGALHVPLDVVAMFALLIIIAVVVWLSGALGSLHFRHTDLGFSTITWAAVSTARHL